MGYTSNHAAQIAQSVEQGTENPCVAGSIPALGTILEENFRPIRVEGRFSQLFEYICSTGIVKYAYSMKKNLYPFLSSFITMSPCLSLMI